MWAFCSERIRLSDPRQLGWPLAGLWRGSHHALSDEGSGMKRDSEVLLMRRERAKGRSQEQAAARAGMSVRTLRRYERRGKLPKPISRAAHLSHPAESVR
jgi:hypothetical protein